MYRIRICSLLVLVTAAPAFSQTLPKDLSLDPFLAGLSQPVALRHAGDGSNRIFIVQKGGAIRVAQLDANGAPTLLPTPFLTLSVTTTSESGLLGLAFHPLFETNGYFYVAFTAPGAEPRLGTTPDQVIARFTVSAGDPNVADPASRLDILRVPDLAGNHNGGDLHFGPDGYLYYSSGDGGPQNDPHGFALCNWRKPADSTPNNCSPAAAPTLNYWLLGKILRIDIDTPTASATAEMCGTTTGQPANYSIPPGNPFIGSANTCDEIWHTGLRNPWRFSFDRLTGDMYIADVGQSAREEVNRSALGVALHFGWGCMEGFRVNKTTAPCINDPTNSFPGSTLPLLDYPRTDGGSISGGYMFRGPYPMMHGTYWFGDYLSDRIWYTSEPMLGTWPKTQFTTHGNVVGFGEDEAGNLYSVSINGDIRKFVSAMTVEEGFIFGDGFEAE
ncbi:MAG TPA: PQQ-dependent sugar dehydrogenase [Xanthomonadaceae bacterium]|nr:PQQ-dependent sugar dehydrogenase [Xanthomonadaceae bacterium]